MTFDVYKVLVRPHEIILEGRFILKAIRLYFYDIFYFVGNNRNVKLWVVFYRYY